MADTDILVSEMTPASQINTTDLMIMTQPDAQAETGYSTKSGTVLQVANKMLKGTEYSTDLPDFTDKTPLGGLEELKADIKALLPIGSASGNPCNFETNIADTLVSLKAAIVASGGNGTPSTPIPIVGHSELNLVRCGVNLWDEETESGYINSSTGAEVSDPSKIRMKNYVRVGANSTYFYKTPVAFYICCYDESKTFLGRVGGSRDTTFTTLPNTAYIRCGFESAYGTTYNHDISINCPSTDTSYHAYNGTPYLVSFGQTVYGGEYDANRGKLIINKAYETINSFSGLAEGNGFKTNTYLSQPAKEAYGALTCNMFTRATNYSQAVGSLQNSIGYNAAGQILLNAYDNGAYITDINDINALIPAGGCQIAYELATPIEIDVSELSVDTIVGVNNIVSDGGGDVSVQYRDSIQHYIDSKIASVQALIL